VLDEQGADIVVPADEHLLDQRPRNAIRFANHNVAAAAAKDNPAPKISDLFDEFKCGRFHS
jgi:hypothetical protein